MNMEKIGQFIGVLRKSRGLTQQEVADCLGVSDKTVSKWECGNGLPDITAIPAIAELFEVTADEILKGERTIREPSPKEDKKVKEQVAYYLAKKVDLLWFTFMVISMGMVVEFLCVFYAMNVGTKPVVYIIITFVSLLNMTFWIQTWKAIKKLKQSEVIKQNISGNGSFQALVFPACRTLFIILYVLVLSISLYVIPVSMDDLYAYAKDNQWIYHSIAGIVAAVGTVGFWLMGREKK